MVLAVNAGTERSEAGVLSPLFDVVGPLDEEALVNVDDPLDEVVLVDVDDPLDELTLVNVDVVLFFVSVVTKSARCDGLLISVPKLLIIADGNNRSPRSKLEELSLSSTATD